MIIVAFFQFGSNPSGATSPLARRKEILALAREYKFIILEGRHNNFFRLKKVIF
jgi:DNA-binding transcriptional MocR family regulator